LTFHRNSLIFFLGTRCHETDQIEGWNTGATSPVAVLRDARFAGSSGRGRYGSNFKSLHWRSALRCAGRRNVGASLTRNDRVRSTQQVMQSVTSCDFAIAIVFARVVCLAAACPMGLTSGARVLLRRIDVVAPADAGPAMSRSDFFVSLLFSLHLREIAQREITQAGRLMAPIARGGRRCPSPLAKWQAVD
jgi:hypothetical protein